MVLMTSRGTGRLENRADGRKGAMREAGRPHKELIKTVDLGPATGRNPAMIRKIATISGFVALAALAAGAAGGALPAASVPMLFLVAVIAAAAREGLRAGVAAALLAFVVCNFLFVEPRFTLRVDHAHDALTLVVLLIAGAATGLIAGRAREEAVRAKSRAAMLAQLAAFAEDLGRAPDPEKIRDLARARLTAAGASPVLLLEREGKLLAPDDTSLNADDLAAAERVHRRHVTQSGAARGWAGSRYDFAPIQGGVLGARADAAGSAMLASIAAQANAAVERLALVGEAEREKLRAALLASLSHDLRTPLATIRGAASSLRELGDALDAPARADLAAAIDEEAARLARHVDNLLQMTRLRAGLDLRPDWIDANDVAHGAAQRARRAYPGRVVKLAADPAHPLVKADATLLEQALFNVIDNAAKFSTQPVDVVVRADDDGLVFRVDDRGPGIAAGDLAHVFEPFFRAPGTSAEGTGLGLAIVAGIVRALGGDVRAASPGVDGAATSVTIRMAQAKIAAV
jgi:two-component system, OmpR family, sensor histidine kinase KdpD